MDSLPPAVPVVIRDMMKQCWRAAGERPNAQYCRMALETLILDLLNAFGRIDLGDLRNFREHRLGNFGGLSSDPTIRFNVKGGQASVVFISDGGGGPLTR